MPSSKAIKKNLKVFFGPFWAQGVRCMVGLQVVLLGAPTSIASTMVLGPHHAAVTHVGDSSERSAPAGAHGSARVHRKVLV
jgi:hypothetical protein